MKQEKFSSKTAEELISIIETPENYQDYIINLAEKELKARTLPQQSITNMVGKIYRTRCQVLFDGNIFVFDNYELPKSFILKITRCKSLFKAELEKYIDRRRALNARVDNYC